jgi:hypothetical protein
MRIRINHANAQELIILIRDIHSGRDGCTTKSVHLSVTKYSFLDPTRLLEKTSQTVEMVDWDKDASREILLHFSDHAFMGTSRDSEVVKIDNILEARPLPLGFEVVHCLKPPTRMSFKSTNLYNGGLHYIADSEENILYCRFARSVSSGTVVIVCTLWHVLKRLDLL